MINLGRRGKGVVIGVSLCATITAGTLAPHVASATEATSVEQSGPKCRYIVVPGGTVVGKQCGTPLPPKVIACLTATFGAWAVAAATGGAMTPAILGAIIGCGVVGVEWAAENDYI